MHSARPNASIFRRLKAHPVALVMALSLCGVANAAPCGGNPEEFLNTLTRIYRTDQDVKTRLLIDEVFGTADKVQHVVRDMLVFNRPSEGKLVMLTQAPKTEAGNGYLRVDRNIWSYDVNLGHWDRRTERDSIAGTNARRSDIDLSDFSDLYAAKGCEEVMVKGHPVEILELVAKPGIDAPFTKEKIWVNDQWLMIRSQDYAATGKLLRSMVVTRKAVVQRKDLKRNVEVATELNLFDEVDKTRKTILRIEGATQGELAPNIFTKAYVESKSR